MPYSWSGHHERQAKRWTECTFIYPDRVYGYWRKLDWKRSSQLGYEDRSRRRMLRCPRRKERLVLQPNCSPFCPGGYSGRSYSSSRSSSRSRSCCSDMPSQWRWNFKCEAEWRTKYPTVHSGRVHGQPGELDRKRCTRLGDEDGSRWGVLRNTRNQPIIL